jgi:hypothetical protein
LQPVGPKHDQLEHILCVGQAKIGALLGQVVDCLQPAFLLLHCLQKLVFFSKQLLQELSLTDGVREDLWFRLFGPSGRLSIRLAVGLWGHFCRILLLIEVLMLLATFASSSSSGGLLGVLGILM